MTNLNIKLRSYNLSILLPLVLTLIWGTAFTFKSHASPYDEVQLGRFFTSDKQRQALEKLKTSYAKNGTTKISHDKEQVTGSSKLVFQGIVLREGKRNVTWINGASSLDKNPPKLPVVSNPNSYNKITSSMPIESNNGVLNIKPGQVWLEDDSTPRELYQYTPKKSLVDQVSANLNELINAP